MRNCDRREDREPKDSHYPMKSIVRSMSMREQQLAKQIMAVSRNNHIIMFGEVFETSLMSWNSFNVCFVILLTLCCTWPTVSKVLATPTIMAYGSTPYVRMAQEEIPYSGKFSLVQIFAEKGPDSSEEIFAVFIFADAGHSGHTPTS